MGWGSGRGKNRRLSSVYCAYTPHSPPLPFLCVRRNSPTHSALVHPLSFSLSFSLLFSMPEGPVGVCEGDREEEEEGLQGSGPR